MFYSIGSWIYSIYVWYKTKTLNKVEESESEITITFDYRDSSPSYDYNRYY